MGSLTIGIIKLTYKICIASKIVDSVVTKFTPTNTQFTKAQPFLVSKEAFR